MKNKMQFVWQTTAPMVFAMNAANADAIKVLSWRQMALDAMVPFHTKTKDLNLFYFADSNECLWTKCAENSRCVNLVGSFRCECLPGFAGSGLNCTKQRSYSNLSQILKLYQMFVPNGLTAATSINANPRQNGCNAGISISVQGIVVNFGMVDANLEKARISFKTMMYIKNIFKIKKILSELRVNLRWIFFRRLFHWSIWPIQWPSQPESWSTTKKYFIRLFGPIRRVSASAMHRWHLETPLLLRQHFCTLPSVLDGCKLCTGKLGNAKNVPKCFHTFE